MVHRVFGFMVPRRPVDYLLLFYCPFAVLPLSICCSGVAPLPAERVSKDGEVPATGYHRLRLSRRGAHRILRAAGQHLEARVTF